MTFTKGHSYSLTLRRSRSRPVTYSHVTYLGPDPARDGVAIFWWAEQVVVLKVEQAVVEDATELSPETT